jgi:hypothetical protein
VVKVALIKQLSVVALFHNLAIVDDDYLIRITDGAQAVGNNETGAALHQSVKERIRSHQTPFPLDLW